MKKILVIELTPLYGAKQSSQFQFEKDNELQAHNSTDRLNLTVEKLPDLALCDINISNLTGGEVLEKSRSDISFPRIPCVHHAGKTDSNNHFCAIRFITSDYLSKLITPQELLRDVAAKLK